MMFGLGSLVVHLAANTAAFTSDLGKAAHEADRRMKSIADAAEKAGKLMGGALIAAGGTMAVLVKQAINGADAMSKMSQGAGIATAAFSEIAYAARLSGVSTEQFATSMARLNRNISDTAAGTGEAREAFAAMNIDVKNLDGSLKNADQIMAEVADQFIEMEDGAGKSALAVMLFGRAGAAMIPMLNSGAKGMAEMREEARALGLTIDTETGRAAERFNDNLSRLNAAKQGVANTIMRALLPQMNALTDAMVEAVKEGDKFTGIARGAVTLFQTLAVVGSDVAFVFRMIGGEIGVWAAQLAALGRGDFAGFRLIGKEWTADAARARAELDAFQARVMGIGTAAQDAGAAVENMVKRKAPQVQESGAADKARREREKVASEYAASLQAQQDILDEASILGVKFLREQDERRAESAKKALEQQKLIAASWVESAQIATDAANDMIYTWDLAGRRIQITRQEFEAIEVSQKRFAEAGKELGFTFQSAFEDAIIEGRKLREVLNAIVQDIARIVLRKAVTEPAGEMLAGLVSQGVSGLFGGAKAAGGPVSSGRAYLVGEEGPELFVPHSSGQIVPNGAGGIVFAPVINIDSRTDRAQVLSLVNQGMRASEARLIDNVLRGGSLARAIGRA